MGQQVYQCLAWHQRAWPVKSRDGDCNAARETRIVRACWTSRAAKHRIWLMLHTVSFDNVSMQIAHSIKIAISCIFLPRLASSDACASITTFICSKWSATISQKSRALSQSVPWGSSAPVTILLVAWCAELFLTEKKVGVLSVSSLFLRRVGVYVGIYVCIRTHTHTLHRWWGIRLWAQESGWNTWRAGRIQID